MFINFESDDRERERDSKGRGWAEREGRERIPSRLRTVSVEPNMWLNHEIVTRADIKSQSLT